MRLHHICRITGLLLAISGCSDDQSTSNLANRSQPVALTSPDIQSVACSIALSPISELDSTSPVVRYQNAVKQDKQWLVNLEKMSWGLIDLARQTSDTGYYTLALESARCMSEQQPDQVDSLVLQAHILNNLHRFKAAQFLAEQAVTKRGQWFEYAVLGDALMEQGQIQRAIASYQHMIDQRPGPQAYSRAAHVRWLLGDIDGAIELMVLAVQANQASQSENHAWAQVNLARYLFQKAEFESSRQLLRHVLNQHHEYPPALVLLGRIELAQNKYLAAIEALKTAVQHNPLPESQWLLYDALIKAGSVQQADKIRQSLQLTGAVNDKRTYALYLATVQSDNQFAVELANQELLSRQDIFSKDALAWALYQSGRVHDAMALIDEALSLQTADARLFYHAALIYQANEKYQQASHLYQQAIALSHMLYPSEQNDFFNQSAVLAVDSNTAEPDRFGEPST